ncbi:hypothetical protein HMPREF0044_1289 [Gleimia coleocanis DSM 15436]|uniref:DUF3866 domain-containing protein n=1 Tax=Gleimia coleocanis DSM 15436 TaxID=525245 RepID=C0W1J9_9ACTO|nr:DUF3866 family protein [Gleimia coleocanis]EEH63365.1 hypothetical protein HMPREF0044_1289 [Gleimia coleocanis DSM 15436]
MQRNAVVTEIKRQWADVVQFQAEITEAPHDAGLFLPGESLRGIAYISLVGPVNVGDKVRLEVSVLAKKLGTGGDASTLSVESLPADSLPEIGHVMKARYTPHQLMVLGAEEEDSPYRAQIQACDSLDGTPVIVADLHSAVPAIVAGIHSVHEGARITYIQDDTAALPLGYSMALAQMRENGALTATVSSGQCFGGDFEAASMPSALLVAKAVTNPDYIVVSQGPGNLGTGVKWGFSGVNAASTMNIASVLGGKVYGVVRASEADERPRHRGISHHSVSVLNELTLVPVILPVPALPSDQDPLTAKLFNSRLAELSIKHQVISVPVEDCRLALVNPPAALRTMGRCLEEDELAFTTAAAAGIYAASH